MCSLPGFYVPEAGMARPKCPSTWVTTRRAPLTAESNISLPCLADARFRFSAATRLPFQLSDFYNTAI